MARDDAYWFPAKRYGWGWGLPTRWQGWGVLLVYFALIGAAIVRYPPERSPIGFLCATTILSIALVGVCWVKGEPPRWRWGEDR
jgi:hypothetical protein